MSVMNGRSFFTNLKPQGLKVNSFSDYSVRQKARIYADLEEVLCSFFDERGILLKSDKLALISKYIKTNELKQHCEDVRLEEALQTKIKSLDLKERDLIIKLLTFERDESEQVVGLEQFFLRSLPFLQKRAEELYEKKDITRRKRSDAVDLSVISDFMHDHCRYAFACACCVMIQFSQTAQSNSFIAVLN